MYVNVRYKSQEFLLNVRRLFNILFDDDAVVFTSTRRIFLKTTTQGIRLRRRVDVLSTTSHAMTQRTASKTGNNTVSD